MSGLKYVAGSTIAILLVASPALAWKNPLHPQCPTNDTSVSWYDYMTGKIPHRGNFKAQVTSVQFHMAKEIADPEAIGNLPTNSCYLVGIWATPGDGYTSYYSLANPPTGSAPVYKNLPGDPKKWEITIQGVVLRYTKAGEVLDKRGRVVGKMMCYSSNECGNF